jgi:hypothetical protein
MAQARGEREKQDRCAPPAGEEHAPDGLHRAALCTF